MAVGKLRYLGLLAALLLAGCWWTAAASAQEAPSWLKTLQKQMESMQGQPSQGRPQETPPGAAAPAKGEGSVLLQIKETPQVRLERAWLQAAPRQASFDFRREGGAWRLQAPAGSYRLYLEVMGPTVAFIVDQGPLTVRAGQSASPAIDLHQVSATMRIEYPSGALPPGATLHFYMDRFSKKSFAEQELPADGRVGGLPIGPLWLAIRAATGAILFEEAITLHAGQESVCRIERFRDLSQPLPLRLWVRSEATPPPSFTAVLKDAAGTRHQLKPASAGLWQAAVLPGTYQLIIKGRGIRQTENLTLGDNGLPVNLLLVISDRSHLCTESDTFRARDYFSRAAKAEKVGRAQDAILFYHAADHCSMSTDARQAVERIGTMLAVQADKKGKDYSGPPLYERRADDPLCKSDSLAFCTTRGERIVFKEELGALDWYLLSSNHAAAEKAMLAAADELPLEEHEQFRNFMEYFATRRNQPAFAAMTEIAGRQGRRALEMEEEVFDHALQGQGWDSSNAAMGRSVQLLEAASRWLTYAQSRQMNEIQRRAQSRGTALLGKTELRPADLEHAQTYYKLAAAPDGFSQIRQVAAQQGEKAARQGSFRLAADFFRLAGNFAEAEKMNAKAEAQNDGEQKSAEQQRRFSRESEALADELGL